MMLVTLSYPNGQSQEILLADAPRKGDSIRLRNGPNNPSLIVEHVTWTEGKETPPEPMLILQVREHTNG
jgi:hypothetical protein